MRTTVWKLGGSLFDMPDLAVRLRRLLETSTTRVLLVPGGGDAADLVRTWQQRTGIDDEAAHWLAIRALDFNAHRLATVLPSATVVTCVAEAVFAWERHEQPVLAPTQFVADAERSAPHNALPHDWTVTSDSLAAWIATAWGCDELVLVKSRSLPKGMDLGSASAAGLVDEYFWRVAPRVTQIAWCDLRADIPVVRRW